MKNRTWRIVIILSVLLGAGTVQADLFVHLTVSELSGSTTTNSGTAGGMGTLGSGVSFVNDLRPETIQSMPVGTALDFDGTANSRVAFNAIEELTNYQNRIVIAAWIKVSDWTHFHHVVHASSAASALLDGFVLALAPTRRLHIVFRPAGQDAQYAASGLALVGDGVWTHVAAKIDIVADTLTLYINGEKLYVKSIPGSNQIKMVADTRLSLNRYPGTDTNLFKGRLDDLKIYNNDMTDEEIEVLATRPSGTLIVIK